jgi:uncharacterized pyridoxal phosphate-containing UPF0001 family protein
MSSIALNLQAAHERIAAAARNVSRDPAQLGLLAVSKTFGPAVVQEAVDKMAAIQAIQPALALEWQVIGPIDGHVGRPEAPVAEGATMVRVETAIFGQR